MRRRRLVAEIDGGDGGYATFYGKHGARPIRVSRRPWEALQTLAEGKGVDERIIAVSDERVPQTTTAIANGSLDGVPSGQGASYAIESA
jgi:hypothetical protein